MPPDDERPDEPCGTAEGPCRGCGTTMPAGAVACPACGRTRAFNQEQWEMLRRCADARDVSAWNAWRAANPATPVELEGADLKGASLIGAHLEGANLEDAHLEGASLWHGHLEGANLWEAHLEGAILRHAHLEGASLWEAHLEGAILRHAHLEGAILFEAHLEGARLDEAHLEGARLDEAHLEGADFSFADIRDVKARGAVVDGRTLLDGCRCDARTDFTAVGLAAARVEPGLRAMLERNVRERAWRRWYAVAPLRRWVTSLPVRAFWLVSDYGHSTARILLAFVVLAFVFAAVYWGAAVASPPGLVAGLTEAAGRPVPEWLLLLRALYFSVVTMTTLGFGDLHAQPDSTGGHALLMVQVFLGYVLLGALITRFAIMFTGPSAPAGGPGAGGPIFK